MKKLALFLAIIMLFVCTATGCGTVLGVEIDYGNSQIFTEDDMKDAIPNILGEFTVMHYEGTLETLTYAGDEACQGKLLKWKNSKKKRLNKYEECMIFYADAEIDVWNIDAGDYSLQKAKYTYILGKNSDGWILENSYWK